MKNILLFGIMIILAGCSHTKKTEKQIIEEKLQFVVEQYKGMVEVTKGNKDLPVSVNATGKMVFAGSSWWTSGFVPGSLWYLFEYAEEFEWLDNARIFSAKIEKEKTNKDTHDLGFMLYCSFGNGFRLTADTAYKSILLTGAKSLASRYNKKVGCIQSWKSNKKWKYPVIIDNMMNLELLMWAFRETGDSLYYRICVSHADTTLKNHFRKDYSSFHLVSYDTISGTVEKMKIAKSKGDSIWVEKKQTVQGANDSSAWARGQSWGLYGYTVMYRTTKLDKYLKQAQGIAEFLINHKNMPKDKIPYWDYNVRDIPNAKRDASAAAIMASALVELSGYVEPKLSKKYLDFAKGQINRLSSSEYLAETGTNGYFLLKHNVGNLPGKSEVDVPLTYADYYYIEALLRLRNKL